MLTTADSSYPFMNSFVVPSCAGTVLNEMLFERQLADSSGPQDRTRSQPNQYNGTRFWLGDPATYRN